MKQVSIERFLAFILLLLILATNQLPASAQSQYDIVIKGGTIFNPSTEHQLEGYRLAIKDGKIARITQDAIKGEIEIDATGLIVAPGFIDLVSYEPNAFGVHFKVQDGVTSTLLMHGGTDDADKWYQQWAKAGVMVNYGASTFITRMRWPIVGHGIDREITAEEDIKRLTDAARLNIERGAVGISLSLEYIPGIKEPEIIPLLQLASEYDAPVFYHLRYSGVEPPHHGPAGIQEVLEYAHMTGAATHIMHINSTGGTFYMEEALQMIHEAREQGLDVTACVYPYDAWATYLSSARFRPGWQQRFNITYGDLQIAGKETRLTEESFNYYRSVVGYPVAVYAHGSMPEEELRMALQDPNVMVGTDTMLTPSLNHHPRGSGTYSRLLGKYVREEQLITMMEAIKMVSLMPAQRMESIAPAMLRKGRLEIGSDADITIFDPETIIDKSTVAKPNIASQGIEYVIINGVIVKDTNGIKTRLTPGQPIYSYFVDQSRAPQALNYQLLINDPGDVPVQVDVDSVFAVNDEIYLPISMLDILEMEYVINPGGNITINGDVSIEVGKTVGSSGGEAVDLLYEPILYQGQVYLHQQSIASLLSTDYIPSIASSGLVLEPIRVEETNPTTDPEETKNTLPNGLLAIGIPLSLAVLAVVVKAVTNTGTSRSV